MLPCENKSNASKNSLLLKWLLFLKICRLTLFAAIYPSISNYNLFERKFVKNKSKTRKEVRPKCFNEI